jgi:hypothetical protein
VWLLWGAVATLRGRGDDGNVGAQETVREERVVRANGNVRGEDSRYVLCAMAVLRALWFGCGWTILETLTAGNWYTVHDLEHGVWESV